MIAPAITFDPEDEDYCIVPGRGRVRRWHKVARDAGLVEPISELAYERVTNAKHRGRQVHEAIEWFLTGRAFDPQDLEDESLPYLQAFLDYWVKHGELLVEVETPIYCAELDFCTTPDFRTRDCVHEIKTTSDRAQIWGLQTAAQQIAAGTLSRRVIWLRPKLKTRKVDVINGGRLGGTHDVFHYLDFDVVHEACRGEYDGPAITAWKALR